MNFKLHILFLLFFICICGFISCSKEKTVRDLAGTWRAVLDSPGGELPFIIEISKPENGNLRAVVRNGEETLPFSSIEQTGNKVKFIFDHYDSFLEGNLDSKGQSIKGEWSRRSLGGTRTRMNFSAVKTLENRFETLDKPAASVSNIKDISGEWTVKFDDSLDDTPAIAIFTQQDFIVTGTFLTAIGDYRFLEGTFEHGTLRLSVFDGAHAFLFKAVLDKNGLLKGDFWSRDTYHTTWTATKGGSEMPDPYNLTKLSNNRKHFCFHFPDVNGNMISNEDARFKSKALIVYIFGTWCPNCNDEAPMLVELYKKYKNDGLEIVGLANEFSGEFAKDKEMVETFAEKYDISWPLLVVGLADKKKTAEALADLDRVISYPTTLFIDRQGKVQKIHTGFTGPGTGKYYDMLYNEFTQTIEAMLRD